MTLGKDGVGECLCDLEDYGRPFSVWRGARRCHACDARRTARRHALDEYWQASDRVRADGYASRPVRDRQVRAAARLGLYRQAADEAALEGEVGPPSPVYPDETWLPPMRVETWGIGLTPRRVTFWPEENRKDPIVSAIVLGLDLDAIIEQHPAGPLLRSFVERFRAGEYPSLGVNASAALLEATGFEVDP